MNLTTYTTQTRRLIHDANAQFWSAQEITDDINLACQKVVADTASLRALVTTLPQATISAGSWSSGTATVTIGAHTIQVGDLITITGVSPTGYNVTGGVITAVTSTQIKYAVSSNPGAYVSGGILVANLETTTAVEKYAFPTVAVSANATVYNLPAMDVLNVAVLQGSVRYVMRYKPWSQFNALLRSMVNFQQLPRYYSVTGQNTVWLAPIPDQTYIMEMDVVYGPPTLVNGTDDDTQVYPFTEPVPYYAAYLAFLGKRRIDVANQMLELYQQRIAEAIHAGQRRRIMVPQR